MKNIFTEHPASIGESYFEHLYFAAKFGSGMVVGGLACLLHAIFPFVFKNTGSNILLRMAHDFICRMPARDDRLQKLATALDNNRCKKE